MWYNVFINKRGDDYMPNYITNVMCLSGDKDKIKKLVENIENLWEEQMERI